MVRRLFFAVIACCVLRGAQSEDDPLTKAWNNFADLGNDFIRKLDSGVFDIKMAAQLSHLWRAVESYKEWPKVPER